MYKTLRAESAHSPNGGTLRIYLKGLQDGIEWSDSFLRTQGKPRVFCAPDNIALNVENYIQFIDEALLAPRDGALTGTYPIALVLIQFLQVKMPCDIK